MRQRFFLQSSNIDQKTAHQMTKVLRYKSDDLVELCYLNQCFLVRLKINKDSVGYDVVEEIVLNNELDITLLQGIPNKEKKIEFILKYSTMFGANCIIFSEFSRSQKTNINYEKRIDRYHAIVKESAKIAHKNKISDIFFKKISDIEYDKYDKIIVAYENEKDIFVKDVISSNDSNKKILIVIGPEGGITKEEIDFFKQKKSYIVSLGNNILTSESANLSILSYLVNKLI